MNRPETASSPQANTVRISSSAGVEFITDGERRRRGHAPGRMTSKTSRLKAKVEPLGSVLVAVALGAEMTLRIHGLAPIAANRSAAVRQLSPPPAHKRGLNSGAPPWGE